MHPAHNSETCRCDHCLVDREVDLIADFWSRTGQSSPVRSRWWIVVDVALLATALTLSWWKLFGSQPL